MTYIDLRSDTVTRPTDEMRAAMAAAAVGDDVYEDDPTAARLQEAAAETLGFEAALFVPSGTMGNQLAIMAHTKRGDEIILGENSHIVAHEVGAAALLANVSYRLVRSPDDTIGARDIDAAVRGSDIHYPETGLVCLENALSNGKVVPMEKMAEACAAAKRHGLPVHLDGARIFNAAAHLNTAPREIARGCDSVMFCLSKGLCSPVGSVLCGSAAFIGKARKFRKLLGGGMRQVGMLAACGLISLEKMTRRLRTDHENARYLAENLSKLPHIALDMASVHINIVFFTVTSPGLNHEALRRGLLERGIKINPAGNAEYRFVTHNDISRADIDRVLSAMRELMGLLA